MEACASLVQMTAPASRVINLNRSLVDEPLFSFSIKSLFKGLQITNCVAHPNFPKADAFPLSQNKSTPIEPKVF